MEADVRRGHWADPGLRRVTFGEWTDEYLPTIVRLRDVTQGDYERALRVHVLPTFGPVPVARIDHVDIRRFVAEKQGRGAGTKDPSASSTGPEAGPGPGQERRGD